MSSPFRKGYSLNGEPKQYHGWMTLQRSLMYEDGLGKVMSGVETAPAALEEDATQLQRTQYAKETRRFEKNGKLFTRVLLATADSRDGYASVAAQVVQAGACWFLFTSSPRMRYLPAPVYSFHLRVLHLDSRNIPLRCPRQPESSLNRRSRWSYTKRER